MKKLFKILGGTLFGLLLILLIVPFLFQDKIVKLVKDAINDNVEATVDFSDASLSLLRNFPNASLQLENISVINHAPFKGDTLFYGKAINLKLPLTGLFGSNIKIKSFSIDDALVNVKVNSEGKANYDIAKPSTETPSNTEETTASSSSGFGLSIQEYAINNSTINYDDAKSHMSLALANFNHSGSGDLSASRTQLKTLTNTLFSFGKDGVMYANNHTLDLDATLDLDLENSKFSFLENTLKVNQLALIFDGFVKLNDNNQEVDLHFKTPTSDFKNFLGLVPEAYAKDISNVKTSGKFSIDGIVKGTVDDNHIPTLDIKLLADNASFKYPELPKTVKNIHLNTEIKNTTGKLENTFIQLNNLSLGIDEDVFKANGSIHNIVNNPLVNMNIDGTLNLANITKAYPVELDTKLSGILSAKLHTKFDVKAIEKNAIERIKNNGKVTLKDFVFSSKDVINPLEIKKTTVNFTPNTVNLAEFDALSGKSDLNASGTLDNLLGFLLADKKLKGNFKLHSNQLHISDFMENNTTEAPKEEEKTPEAPVPGTETSLKIPAFLDCTVQANAGTVYYDNLTLSKVQGTLKLKDQKAILQNVNANIFNGTITLNGEVSTQKKQPSFAMKMGIKSFNLGQSFKSLDLLQSLSPIAGAMDGNLNSTIDLSGNLKNDFTPNLATLSGDVLAQLLGTKVSPEKSKALNLLDSKLNFLDLNKLDLSDIKTHLSFKDGKVNVKPFKLNYKDIGINIGGSHGFDQSMNYNLTFDVPAKYLGSDVQNLLNKLDASEGNTKVPITANITGNMTSPSIKTDMAQSVTKLTQSLVNKQKNKLVDGALNKLLGGKSNTKADSTKTKSDKTVDQVKGVLNGLFGKKKKKKGGN